MAPYLAHPMCDLSGADDDDAELTVDGPQQTPLETVALRGTAGVATRIAVKNASTGASTVEIPGTEGRYCADVALGPGTTEFLVSGISEYGDIAGPLSIEVTRDADAPTPSDPTCGAEVECNAVETCGNGSDDDCNGLADDCDPVCNGCQDDTHEPNDVPFAVPTLAAGSYPDLKVCPCRDDWFALDLTQGQNVVVTIDFIHDLVDLDLKLYLPAAAEAGVDDPIAESTTTNNTESITFAPAQSGIYYLKVYSFRKDGQGSYSLLIQ